jgi:hypothetical protein
MSLDRDLRLLHDALLDHRNPAKSVQGWNEYVPTARC